MPCNGATCCARGCPDDNVTGRRCQASNARVLRFHCVRCSSSERSFCESSIRSGFVLIMPGETQAVNTSVSGGRGGNGGEGGAQGGGGGTGEGPRLNYDITTKHLAMHFALQNEGVSRQLSDAARDLRCAPDGHALPSPPRRSLTGVDEHNPSYRKSSAEGENHPSPSFGPASRLRGGGTDDSSSEAESDAPKRKRRKFKPKKPVFKGKGKGRASDSGSHGEHATVPYDATVPCALFCSCSLRCHCTVQ
ncbi:hypothetical protein B0H13DRAFT_2095898 [Mycena leptocephala]|nr:hypothetical protein B0H13DRAFT_2095898 [Mycena leptocephala]